MRLLFNGYPAQWGNPTALEGAAVIAVSTAPATWRFTASVDHCLINFSPQPMWHLSVGATHWRNGPAPVGAVQIIPRNSIASVSWAADLECLVLALSADRLERLMGPTSIKELIWKLPGHTATDAAALSLARQVQRELEIEAVASRGCLDAWIDLLTAHMVRTYSNLVEAKGRPHLGGLSARTRRKVEDYLLENVSTHVTLKELAAVAQLSASHFARAFRTTFGTSPHQYVLNLRLAHARQRVIGSDLSLDQIAREAGFANNSHLTSLMRRNFGVTPSQIRNAHREASKALPVV